MVEVVVVRVASTCSPLMIAIMKGAVSPVEIASLALISTTTTSTLISAAIASTLIRTTMIATTAIAIPLTVVAIIVVATTIATLVSIVATVVATAAAATTAVAVAIAAAATTAVSIIAARRPITVSIIALTTWTSIVVISGPPRSSTVVIQMLSEIGFHPTCNIIAVTVVSQRIRSTVHCVLRVLLHDFRKHSPKHALLIFVVPISNGSVELTCIFQNLIKALKHVLRRPQLVLIGLEKVDVSHIVKALLDGIACVGLLRQVCQHSTNKVRYRLIGFLVVVWIMDVDHFLERLLQG